MCSRCLQPGSFLLKQGLMPYVSIPLPCKCLHQRLALFSFSLTSTWCYRWFFQKTVNALLKVCCFVLFVFVVHLFLFLNIDNSGLNSFLNTHDFRWELFSSISAAKTVHVLLFLYELRILRGQEDPRYPFGYLMLPFMSDCHTYSHTTSSRILWVLNY